MPLLAALAVIVLLVAGFAWWKRQAAPPSGTATAPANRPASGATKNAIIVADFVNHTGDAVFETTLNQALAVQLGQSPVLDIVSPQHLRQSLQYLGKKPDEAITPAIAREMASVRASRPSSPGPSPTWISLYSGSCRMTCSRLVIG